MSIRFGLKTGCDIHWGQRWRMGGVTVKRRRRWCSDRNQRAGGISGGGSRRGGHVGDGEGEELELRRGMEQSDAPTAFPNWRVRGEERKREMGGGGVDSSVPRGGKEKGERERARGPGHGGQQHGVKDMAGNGP
jgi:hypothetical protein